MALAANLNSLTRRTIKSILLQAGFSEEEIEKLTVAQLTFWLNCRRLNQTGNKKETVGKVSDVIFLDFSKALDSVPNKRLLLKLNRNGIDGQLYLWFRIFFNQHKTKSTDTWIVFRVVARYIWRPSRLNPGSDYVPYLRERDT